MLWLLCVTRSRLAAELQRMSAACTTLQGPVPLIPDAAAKHVDFVDFPSIHPDFTGKPFRYTAISISDGGWAGMLLFCTRLQIESDAAAVQA